MTTHTERTANAPRQSGLHRVMLSQIRPLNKTVRLLRFALPYSITFLPGQWVDLHVPGLTSPGGFTIVSSPRDAAPSDTTRPAATASPRPPPPPLSQDIKIQTDTTKKIPERPTLESEIARRSRTTRSLKEHSLSPSRLLQWQQQQQPGSAHISLAVQLTSNPPARWLWRAPEEILGQELQLKIGGSFVWPPPGVDPAKVRKVVFVAGGVGINPFISMLKHMYEHPDTLPPHITLLYGHKSQQDLRDIPFLDLLASQFENESLRTPDRQLRIFLTGELDGAYDSLLADRWSEVVSVRKSRMTEADVLGAAVGGESDGVDGGVEDGGAGAGDAGGVGGGEGGKTDGETVAYVCGPGGFVDENVLRLQTALGEERVFFEKWW